VVLPPSPLPASMPASTRTRILRLCPTHLSVCHVLLVAPLAVAKWVLHGIGAEEGVRWVGGVAAMHAAETVGVPMMGVTLPHPLIHPLTHPLTHPLNISAMAPLSRLAVDVVLSCVREHEDGEGVGKDGPVRGRGRAKVAGVTGWVAFDGKGMRSSMVLRVVHPSPTSSTLTTPNTIPRHQLIDDPTPNATATTMPSHRLQMDPTTLATPSPTCPTPLQAECTHCEELFIGPLIGSIFFFMATILAFLR
jgi:hypothetical protein